MTALSLDRVETRAAACAPSPERAAGRGRPSRCCCSIRWPPSASRPGWRGGAVSAWPRRRVLPLALVVLAGAARGAWRCWRRTRAHRRRWRPRARCGRESRRRCSAGRRARPAPAARWPPRWTRSRRWTAMSRASCRRAPPPLPRRPSCWRGDGVREPGGGGDIAADAHSLRRGDGAGGRAAAGETDRRVRGDGAALLRLRRTGSARSLILAFQAGEARRRRRSARRRTRRRGGR